MVILKQSLTGNCLLVNLKASQSSVGWFWILEIKIFCPACCPVRSSTSSTLFLYLVKIPLLPLHTSCAASRFLRIMMGHPAFSSSCDSGRPEQFTALRYSTG